MPRHLYQFCQFLHHVPYIFVFHSHTHIIHFSNPTRKHLRDQTNRLFRVGFFLYLVQYCIYKCKHVKCIAHIVHPRSAWSETWMTHFEDALLRVFHVSKTSKKNSIPTLLQVIQLLNQDENLHTFCNGTHVMQLISDKVTMQL